MAKKNVKVNLPVKKPEDFILLGGKIFDRCTVMGIDCPINNVNMPTFETLLRDIESKRNQSKDLRAQSESLMQQATDQMGFGVGQSSETPDTLYHYITLIRDLLLVVYHGNEEELSRFGFDVVISASASPNHEPEPPV